MNALEEREPIDIVYIDLHKAYDRTPYQRLLCKWRLCVARLTPRL